VVLKEIHRRRRTPFGGATPLDLQGRAIDAVANERKGIG
jgi:hypothetical protein